MITKNKITLLIFGILFAFSCGQTNNTPASNPAESIDKEEQKVTTTSISPTDTASQDMAFAEEKEEKLVAESTESVSQKTEKPEIVPEGSKKSEVTTTPKPVAVSQKNPTKESTKVIEKITDIKEKEEVVMEVSNKTVEEKPKAVKPVKVPVVETPAFSHEVFDQLLRKNVSSTGKVNYNNFKADEAKLDAYLKMLNENPPASGWSKSKKMAYWINAYNAGTIKLILKNYPVSSITKLHGGKPWDQKWVPLGGKTYSLNNIENDILRPVYKDARIHFAVNCAAKSCPPLLNRAWTEGNLNKYLAKQTKSFINDSAQNTITAEAVEISKIFEWYAVDFGSIIDFLNKYSTVKINSGAKVTYKEYNWDLNK